jgi:RNA polymerase sigma-70 factor (ECF subfamily)
MTIATEAAGYPARLTEPSAIGHAYVAAAESLRGFISRLGASPSDIEDIAQEALACALKAETERLIENPKAYLFRVAHNLTLQHRLNRARSLIEDIETAAMEGVACEKPSIEDQVISREQLALVLEAVEALPPVCRRVFLLRKVYGYSHREIADQLGITVSTVEKHLGKGFARCLVAMGR